jgi:hypothetical protein
MARSAMRALRPAPGEELHCIGPLLCRFSDAGDDDL